MSELEGFVSNQDVENILFQATNEELLCITKTLGMPAHDAYPVRAKEIYEKLQTTASHLLKRIFNRDKKPAYCEIVHSVSKKLETHSSDKDSDWARNNYKILENQIFEVVFQTYLSSLDENQRKKLEDELGTLAWQLGENYSSLGGGVFALAAASVGGTSIIAAMTTTLGAVFGPVTWLALGGIAAYKYGAPDYKKIVPCITIISSIRQRLEFKMNQRVNDFNWQESISNIQVKNGF